MDESGIQELALDGISAVAGEMLVQRPDLILVNPGALALEGEPLVRELNRLAHFEPGYAWEPALGELPL